MFCKYCGASLKTGIVCEKCNNENLLVKRSTELNKIMGPPKGPVSGNGEKGIKELLEKEYSKGYSKGSEAGYRAGFREGSAQKQQNVKQSAKKRIRIIVLFVILLLATNTITVIFTANVSTQKPTQTSVVTQFDGTATEFGGTTSEDSAEDSSAVNERTLSHDDSNNCAWTE